MLKTIAPPFLEFDKPGIGASSMSKVPMHFKFEVNLITNEIIGPQPEVKILRISWLCKRHYIKRYLVDYYAGNKTLPIGYHDLGTTDSLKLNIGVVDFDTIRERVDAELQRKERRNLRASHKFRINNLIESLSENLISVVTKFYQNYLSNRFYYRGQWFTRRKWHHHHGKSL